MKITKKSNHFHNLIPMNQLKLIIQNEFFTEIKSKGFWIGTFLVPIIIIVVGGILGFLMSEADTFTSTVEKLPTQPDASEMSDQQVIGMIAGTCLFFFIMTYGAMIFNKVKTEKCNRIMEILATCVDGKTMMLAKILSVGLIGLVQLIAWGILIFVGIIVFFLIFQFAVPTEFFANPETYLMLLWILLYFVGGYILFGSLYAACGAITDKDNENQIYMTVITFILLGAFYLGQYAVDKGSSALGIACTYIPFTSPIVGTVNAVTETTGIWETLLSIAILYICSFFSIAIAGKLYRSSMLLKGKNFSPKDIITFIKS